MGGGMRVATTTCLNWSKFSVPHSPSSSSSQNMTSVVNSSSKRRSLTEGFLFSRYARTPDRSAFFGCCSTKLYRSRSCEIPKPIGGGGTIRRNCSASLDEFSDEEFSKKIQEIAMRFQLSDDKNDDNDRGRMDEEDTIELADVRVSETCFDSFAENQNPFLLSSNPFLLSSQPDWQDIIPASIERKANSVELPLSLRMIKRKKQWKQGFIEVGESAYSVKKAFSSMVFIIRELQSYLLQMREILFYEDLQGILVRVQKEMNASFVWLFQQVFSHTPTLMLYVMILLANYSVYSMASNAALASTPPVAQSATVESVSNVERDQKFDSSAIKTFSVSSSSGKTAAIGGSNGGGGKFKNIASGTDGDGRFDGFISSDYHGTAVPDGASSIGNPSRTGEEESISGQASREEELSLWDSVLEEASRMQAVLRDGSLDHETMQRFVSPVTAKIESDDYADYIRTELLYQNGLVQEPSNTLLLANYAQFLYLVAQDYDRAEEYFKRAVNVEPKDAEALSKYASFLWQARNDLWAAEETYLEAISTDPSNSYYAANYAHFLWSTGGEDTCFPLSSPPDTNTT